MPGIPRFCSSARSLFRRVALPPPTRHQQRAFAAAAELAYWSDWDEQDEPQLDRRRGAATDTWRDREPPRSVQWVFMGSPGAQKRVYATRMAELLDVPYISMGTLVRQELHPKSALYKKIANAVNEGRLVPEDIIFGLLSKRLEEGWQGGETGFILDGIPRTRIQAEILDQIAEIDLVINLKSFGEGLVKKPFGTDICYHCGKHFDASNSESSSLNPCLGTRTRHAYLKSSSAIDTENANIEKFRIHVEQSKILEEYYRNQEKLLNFEVSGGPRETWKGLLAALHLQHMDTLNFSQKLTKTKFPTFTLF